MNNNKDNNLKAVMESVKCLRQFYKEIASFLLVLDKLVEKKDYKCTGGKNVIIDTSHNLKNFESWLPVVFYRNYKKNQKTLFTTNIVLHQEVEKIEIKEPLFIATKYKFNKGFKRDAWEGTSWSIYFYTSVNAMKTGEIYDKKLIFDKTNKKRLKDNGEWKDEEFDMVEDLKFMAIPLLEINDEKDIENKILNKFDL